MKQNDMAEIELSIQDLTLGKDFTRSIVIKSENPNYDNKTIKYRALTATEFTIAMEKAGLGKEQDPSSSFKFLIRACEMGIVTPGIGPKAGTLDKDIITEVGGKILGVSQSNEAKVAKTFPEQ